LGTAEKPTFLSLRATPTKRRPLKNDFVAAKRSFASDDDKAELDALQLQKYGFFQQFPKAGTF